MGKMGSKVTVEADGGMQYTRNSAHSRKFQQTTREENEINLERGVETKDSDSD